MTYVIYARFSILFLFHFRDSYYKVQDQCNNHKYFVHYKNNSNIYHLRLKKKQLIHHNAYL